EIPAAPGKRSGAASHTEGLPQGSDANGRRERHGGLFLRPKPAADRPIEISRKAKRPSGGPKGRMEKTGVPPRLHSNLRFADRNAGAHEMPLAGSIEGHGEVTLAGKTAGGQTCVALGPRPSALEPERSETRAEGPAPRAEPATASFFALRS